MWVNINEPTLKELRSKLKGTRNRELRQFLKDLDEREAADKDPELQSYRDAANELYGREGELEFDPGAVVSVSDDGGAYVMGWRWVYDEQVGAGE